MNPLFERALARGVDPKTLIMLERFEEQTERDPDDADAYAEMGAWWLGKSDFHAAIEHLDKALILNPDHIYALRDRAKLRATCAEPSFRDGEGALRDITQAMEIEEATGRLCGDWLHRLYLRIRAAAHAELGQYDIAITVATEALELSITKLAREGGVGACPIRNWRTTPGYYSLESWGRLRTTKVRQYQHPNGACYGS